jgi:OOP family OmpA-OmpF porin
MQIAVTWRIRMRKLATIAASCLLASGAYAQDDLEGPYFGVAVGHVDYQQADDEDGIFIDDTTTAFRLIGGYQLNENLAIEAGWARTGDLKESFQLFPPGSGTLDFRADYEMLTVRALGLVPLDQIDIYGGIGYYDATITADVALTGVGSLGEVEDDENGVTLLGGVHFYLDKFTIRGEYEWFDTDSNIETWDLSVGILFRF